MSYPVRTRLTDAMITKFPFHPSGQKMIADTGQPGLYLMVRKTSKKFAAQREIRIMGEDMKPKRKTVRRMLKATSVADARTETLYVLAEIEKGEVGNRPDGSITLRDAWARYKSALEKTGKSPATIYGYRNAVETEHLLGIWLDTPLRDLATGEGMKIVAARHEAITLGQTGGGGGPYAANGTMRALRAIYNWCLSRGFAKPDPDGNFPTRQIVFNPEEAKDEAMSRLDLPEWWAAYNEMPNRVRAEFQLFLLLSGMRSGSLVDAKWEHVDVGSRSLHVPTPKGGKAKAYDIPLTRQMLASLARARRAARVRSPNFADTIIFPGDQTKAVRGSNSFSGHMSKYSTREPKLPCSGHALRHTYRNACVWAGVEENLSKKLMNHSQKGDVHSGTYGSVRGVWPDLCDAQARISTTIFDLFNQQ